MVENVLLTLALAREVQIGQPIKAKRFNPVAEILAAIYRLRKGATRQLAFWKPIHGRILDFSPRVWSRQNILEYRPG